MNVILFGSRFICKEVNKRQNWIRVVSNPMTSIPIRRGRFGQTHRRVGRVKMETETGIMNVSVN